MSHEQDAPAEANPMPSISPFDRLPSPASDLRYESPESITTEPLNNPLFPLLDRVISDRDALKLLNDHLSTQVATLGKRLEQTTREKMQLEQDYGYLDEEKNTLVEAGESQNAHVRSLETYIAALLGQKRSLEAVFEFKIDSSTTHKDSKGPKEPEVKHAGDLIAVLKAKYKKLDGENAQLRNSNFDLEEKLANMKKLCQYIEEENRDLKEEVQEKEEEIKVLEETPSSERYCMVLEGRNNFLKQELAISKQDSNFLEGRILALRTEMEDRPWRQYSIELESEYQILKDEMSKEQALRIEREKDRSWKQFCIKLEAENRDLKERIRDEESWKEHCGELETEIHLSKQKIASMLQDTKKVEGKTTTFKGVFKSMDSEKEKFRNEYLALGLTEDKTILFEKLTNDLSTLKNKLAQQEPLVQVALSIRLRFLERNRARFGFCPAHETNAENIQRGDISANCGNISADTALIALNHLRDKQPLMDVLKKIYDGADLSTIVGVPNSSRMDKEEMDVRSSMATMKILCEKCNINSCGPSCLLQEDHMLFYQHATECLEMFDFHKRQKWSLRDAHLSRERRATEKKLKKMQEILDATVLREKQNVRRRAAK